MTDVSLVNTHNLVMPVVSPKEILEYQTTVHKLIQEGLTKDVDYGIIPGTGDKPALLKPGAERLTIAFGAAPEFEILTAEVDHNAEMVWQKKKKVWNNAYKGDRTFRFDMETGTSLGLYRFIIKCRIVRNGRLLGEGIGSCSSLESKYCDRPRDLENTIIKMAKKRAHVAATLCAFGLSNRFTQDIEDMQDNKKASEIDNAEIIFSSENKDHLASLEKALQKKKIPEKDWDDIALRMNGKAFNQRELNTVIGPH